jgi:hypothetical protein
MEQERSHLENADSHRCFNRLEDPHQVIAPEANDADVMVLGARFYRLCRWPHQLLESRR